MIHAKPAVKEKKSMNSNTILLLLTIGLFVVMYAAGCIAYADKGFTKLQTFLDILKNNAGLICVTCGMTAVMITGGIDISVGAVIAMECMFLAVGVESWGLPAQLLIPLMLVIGVVFGIIQGYCVGYLGIQPFIVTMAGMFFARGMTAVISTQQVSITSSSLMTELSMMKFNMPFEIGAYLNKKGKLMVPNVSIYVIIALLVLIATFFILRYTRFGRSLYAVGGNQQSAALMGLDVRRTRFNAHIFCSVLTSIGAICYVLNTMCGTTRQALGLEMDAISSARHRRHAPHRRRGQRVRLLLRGAHQRHHLLAGQNQRQAQLLLAQRGHGAAAVLLYRAAGDLRQGQGAPQLIPGPLMPLRAGPAGDLSVKEEPRDHPSNIISDNHLSRREQNMQKQEQAAWVREGRCALGIELGSTRIKAVLIGPDHAPVAMGAHDWENRLEDGVWTYHLDDVWTGIQDAYADLARNALETCGEPLARLEAVGISAMMHGYLPFDAAATSWPPSAPGATP